MSNFLDVDDSILTRNLLLGGGPKGDSDGDRLSLLGPSFQGRPLLTPSDRKEQSQCKFIIPQPGLCVKTVDLETGKKFFLNLCKSGDVPEPDFDYPDEQIAKILADGTDIEIDDIRIPMSIGETHEEKDNKGTPCLACDVIINGTFFEQRIIASEVYRTFLIVIALEGVDEKHKLNSDKSNYTILSNKRSVGKLNPQFVKARPGIREMKGSGSSSGTGKMPVPVSTTTTTPGGGGDEGKNAKKLVEEIATDADASMLEYDITQLSADAARAEIKVPKLRNPKKISVTLGADRILVESPVGSLDIYVPLDIHQEECKAEFNVDEELLILHLPLVVKP